MHQINTLIKPTHECNMRCRYCFAEKYGYENSLLDINKLKRYIELLAERYKYINLVWHGGEPLMVPLDYYQEIYDYCKKFDSKFIYSLQITPKQRHCSGRKSIIDRRSFRLVFFDSYYTVLANV